MTKKVTEKPAVEKTETPVTVEQVVAALLLRYGSIVLTVDELERATGMTVSIVRQAASEVLVTASE